MEKMDELKLASIRPGIKLTVGDEEANEIFSDLLQTMKTSNAQPTLQPILLDSYIVDNALCCGRF